MPPESKVNPLPTSNKVGLRGAVLYSRITILGGEICWTQPTLHRRRLFVRNHSRAVCLYLGELTDLEASTRDRAIAASDVPQREYVDVATLILGIEPEYAFDIPSMSWLWNWFLVSIAGILPSAFVLTLALRMIVGKRYGYDVWRWMFWIAAFVGGSLGTTLISRWYGDFVFTWPVCIFVAFQAAIAESRSRASNSAGHSSRLRSFATLLLLFASCLAYFLLCRRLSLVFEWVFLCGFIAAAPFSIVGSMWFQDRTWRPAWEGMLTLLAFASFYWASAAILIFKA